MDDSNAPPLKTRILMRSSRPGRLRGQLLVEAYQLVCPEIRLPLPDKSLPTPRVAGRWPAAAVTAAGA